MQNKIAFCDTGFVIRLLDSTNDLHRNALGYYRYLLENDYLIRMSTIAIAEFCVRDSIENLPLRQILPTPYNAAHANKTGRCARLLYEAKSKGVLEVDARIIIQNDVKLIAQAECEAAEYYLTSDTKSKKMYDILKQHGEVTFNFVDIHKPYSEIFGVLNFPPT